MAKKKKLPRYKQAEQDKINRQKSTDLRLLMSAMFK